MLLKELHDLDDDYIAYKEDVKAVLSKSGMNVERLPEELIEKISKDAWNHGEVRPEEAAQHIIKVIRKA